MSESQRIMQQSVRVVPAGEETGQSVRVGRVGSAREEIEGNSPPTQSTKPHLGANNLKKGKQNKKIFYIASHTACRLQFHSFSVLF